jgi:hypothetical protein
MAAPLGFKTFTTGEVLTAADTNGYLMQGVLVFANAAARTAAVTSPQEGQTSYLKDTDAIEVYSGSAWVTKSGSSGMTLLSTTTLSGASTTISSINQTYTELLVYFYGVSNATADGKFRIDINSDGQNVYGTTIYATTVGSTPGSYVIESGANVLRTATALAGIVRLPVYANTDKWKNIYCNMFYDKSGGGNQTDTILANYISTNAITALKFSNTGGNFSTGTVKIWGI